MAVDDTPITTQDDFHRRLEAVVAEALRNDVTIEGGWTCCNTTDQYDYDVNVVPLRKQE